MIEFFIAEGLVGSSAEPKLPIERLLVNGLRRPIPSVVLPPIGSDLGNAAQAAALNEIDGIAEVSPTALLRAALQNLLAGADGAGESGAFFEGVSDGLFQVDVFAGGQGIGCHAHVPVVGRGDEDGIDLLLEHLAVVQVGGGQSVGALLDGIAVRRIDVADGDDLVRTGFIGGIEQATHPAAGADDSDANGVVGAKRPGRGERGKGAGNKKTAAIKRVCQRGPLRFFVLIWLRGCLRFPEVFAGAKSRPVNSRIQLQSAISMPRKYTAWPLRRESNLP